jgi:uncharacterized membrane protein
MNLTDHQLPRRRLVRGVACLWWSLRTASLRHLALAGSGWITLLGAAVMPPASLARVVVVFGFVLVCPGLAVSALLPARDPAERWVLIIALSTSLAILVSVALTVLRTESVTLRVALLAVITTVAVVTDLCQPRGSSAPVRTPHQKARP